MKHAIFVARKKSRKIELSLRMKSERKSAIKSKIRNLLGLQ